MSHRASLAEIRSRTYKEQDSWWTVLLVDPLAGRLVRLVSPWRRVTPDRLTALAFLVGVGAALSFRQAGHPWLLLGALLFHLGFVLDCVDGKVARLNGSGTPFGSWLDYVLDRLRVVVCAVALFGGQYERTHDFAYVWLAGLVIFLDMFRYLNALQMGKVRAEVGTGEAAPPGRGRLHRLRDALARRRIRPVLFSGIEFAMFVFIVGPVLARIVVTTLVAAVLLVAFELLLIYRLYRLTRRRAAAV